jgi:hypothetical protein
MESGHRTMSLVPASLQGSSKTSRYAGVRYRSIVSRVALGGSMRFKVKERIEELGKQRGRQVSNKITRGG